MISSDEQRASTSESEVSSACQQPLTWGVAGRWGWRGGRAGRWCGGGGEVGGRWWGGGAEVVGRWRRAHHAAYDLLLAERRRLERVCGGDVVRCRDGAGAARRVRDEQRLRWRLR